MPTNPFKDSSMPKPLAVTLAVIVVLLIITAVLMAASRRAAPAVYFDPDLPHPLVIAHQGGDGLWPSNTLFAFERAADLGADVIETDMHMTSDGVLVFSHDDMVDRLSNGAGQIKEMTFAQLKSLDAGYRWSNDGGQTFPYRDMGITYPSVAEVFAAMPAMRFNIDMKQTDPPVYEAFCDLIREYRMENRVLAASFHDTNIKAFRQICPGVATSAAQNETRDFVLANFVMLGRTFSPPYQAFQVPLSSGGIPIITRRFVTAAHERGVRVDVWTIDDPREMRRLIDLGVDGIITDRPDLLLEVLGRPGKPE